MPTAVHYTLYAPRATLAMTSCEQPLVRLVRTARRQVNHEHDHSGTRAVTENKNNARFVQCEERTSVSGIALRSIAAIAAGDGGASEGGCRLRAGLQARRPVLVF